MTEQQLEKAVEEVWGLFRETDSQFKAIAGRFKETDAQFKETDVKFKETDARMARLQQETTENLNRLEAMFGSQWGKMLEALVQPGVLRLFLDRGIPVRRLHQRSQSQVDGDTMEIDLILEDETDIIVVEVKSTLHVDDVRDFLTDLDEFPRFFPRFAGYRIFGAVAALSVEEGADRFAYRKGLFVVSVTGDGLVSIKNNESFQPRDFGLNARG